MDSAGSNIVVMKDVILPKTRRVADVLKTMKSVSVFYEMLYKNHIKNIFETKEVKKVCFNENTCVKLTQSMQDHLKVGLKLVLNPVHSRPIERRS